MRLQVGTHALHEYLVKLFEVVTKDRLRISESTLVPGDWEGPWGLVLTRGWWRGNAVVAYLSPAATPIDISPA